MEYYSDIRKNNIMSSEMRSPSVAQVGLELLAEVILSCPSTGLNYRLMSPCPSLDVCFHIY
jgi:hypothetical protein